MNNRLDVLKTYKLFIDGKFPRTESGRSLPVLGTKGELLAHACRASRKDLRESVEAARRAAPAWADSSAYLRGQILYRLAEMLESRRAEFVELLSASKSKGRATRDASLAPKDEVAASIDRLVTFAGWADKHAQVLGCANPVTGPYHVFSIPEPTGVVAIVAPARPALLGLISLMAPPLCAGCTIVAVCSGPAILPAAVLAEVMATSDVPSGVINILTAEQNELISHVASHRDIDAIHAAGMTDEQSTMLRAGAGENLKRVVVRHLREQDWARSDACKGPWWIEPFVEIKTLWHPAAT